jgi:AmmeMemoRadiSam system protein A
MSALNDEDRNALLIVARSAIKAELYNDSKVERPANLTGNLQENRGCFVSLHQNDMLRGCIGTIEPTEPLVTNVEKNACNSAFRDPRFSPLGKEEFSTVAIEISVLTIPTELSFSGGDDLKSKLIPGVHGVILSREWQTATFLPQVWEQLPDVEIFLEHLCQKAGMDKHCWQDTATNVRIYEAEYFSE